VLKQAVEGISDLITTPGIINIDFADIRSVLENTGTALMGIGTASGEKRAEDAAKLAISSPLLDVSIAGAKGVLFSIAGGDDLTMFEIQDAAKIITESIDPNAKVIFGTVRDEKLKKGEIKVTVIASGFGDAPTMAAAPAIRSKSLFSSSMPVEHKEEPKGKIHNTVTPPPAPVAKEEKPEPKVVIEDKKATIPTIESEDDDWGAVPAFLRRKK
jgi:cell division protein FtsZ